MGLSKEDNGVIEEIQTLEITAAHKRRLRRKKLKAARVESSDTDSITQKQSHPVETNLSKPISKEGNVSNKKQKNKCSGVDLNKNHNSVIKDTTLVSNLKCDKTSVANNLKSPSQDTVFKKNCMATTKNTKNQDITGDGPHTIIINHNNIPKLDNSQTIAENKTEHQKKASNKKQKSKVNGNHQIKPENTCTVENKKNESVSSLIIDNQTTVKQRLNEKPTILSQGLPNNDNENPTLKNQCEIENNLPSDTDLVSTKAKDLNSFESQSITIFDKLKSESPESKQQKGESVENETNIVEISNMGKITDPPKSQKKQEEVTKLEINKEGAPSKDESAKSRDDIKAAREAKKLAKQKAKKKNETVDEPVEVKTVVSKTDVQDKVNDIAAQNKKESIKKPDKSMPAEPASDSKSKENMPPADTGRAEGSEKKSLLKSKEDVKNDTPQDKPEETSKSKAELRAERRAKQEAQRAAKQESQRVAKPAEQKTVPENKDKEPVKGKEEKSPKTKPTEKSKSKTQGMQRVGWLQHLCVEKDKASINNIPINSSLHPAVVKLGVQLATGVVTGSNARCIALLDAIKKMVRDYSLPARTEVGRGLQAQLAAAEGYLWARRAPAAAETNALKHFRRHLTQLPANIDEFDAKKQLQQEIDRYIREQIDMAGEAISLILRNKISPGDHILTYGCSSLIERVLCSAWEAGVRFRATVAGARGQRGRDMLRRLRARGVPAHYVDISALSYVMADVQKVVLGAGALLAHGAALGAAGSAAAALLARARNVPVLVACETHKFSERTHLDPLVAHEIGDPDDLIDKTDESSPIKDWRSNPNLTLLNVTYDVTPPALITAVVTELGILPCTSAPVVLRFKQSEYGM